MSQVISMASRLRFSILFLMFRQAGWCLLRNCLSPRMIRKQQKEARHYSQGLQLPSAFVGGGSILKGAAERE